MIIKKYNYAIIKLHLNQDNVWDNLKILWNYDGSDSQRKMEMHYFKLENNTNVFYSKDQDNNIITYADTSVDDEKFNEVAYNACLGTMNGEYHSFTKDEIEQVEILHERDEEPFYEVVVPAANVDIEALQASGVFVLNVSASEVCKYITSEAKEGIDHVFK